jgi:hypothetical protein
VLASLAADVVVAVGLAVRSSAIELVGWVALFGVVLTVVRVTAYQRRVVKLSRKRVAVAKRVNADQVASYARLSEQLELLPVPARFAGEYVQLMALQEQLAELSKPGDGRLAPDPDRQSRSLALREDGARLRARVAGAAQSRSEHEFGSALLDQIEARTREARERAAEQHRALRELIAGIKKLRVPRRFAAAHESLLNALEAQLAAQDAYVEAAIEGDLNAFPGAFAEWTRACTEVQGAGRQLNQMFGVGDPPASRASRIIKQLPVVVCAIALIGVGEAVGSSGGSSGNAAGRVIGAPIAVPRFPVSIAFGRGDLWIGNDMDAYPSNSVTRIDARTGALIGAPIGVGEAGERGDRVRPGWPMGGQPAGRLPERHAVRARRTHRQGDHQLRRRRRRDHCPGGRWRLRLGAGRWNCHA